MTDIYRIPARDITETHLQELVTASVVEDRYLDYKLELKVGIDADKRELCVDVTSFANGAGGLLLFGIKEGNGGVAEEVVGIEVPDSDKL